MSDSKVTKSIAQYFLLHFARTDFLQRTMLFSFLRTWTVQLVIMYVIQTCCYMRYILTSGMSAEACDNPGPPMRVETNRTQTCSISSLCPKDSPVSLWHCFSSVYPMCQFLMPIVRPSRRFHQLLSPPLPWTV